MPKYILIAGANGVGKSTLFHTLKDMNEMPRINTDKDVERRYTESLANLMRAIETCDIVALYDNTVSFRRFAVFRNGTLVKLSHEVPQWFEKTNNRNVQF